MTLILLLVFFAVSAFLLWVGQRTVPTGTPTGRVTAAFVGIWFATLVGTFMLLLMGLAETRPIGEVGTVVVPVAIAEAFWIIVTCGVKSAARVPVACALFSIVILVWLALT